MPISQIVAVDPSAFQLAYNPATEIISHNGDGFEAYLARIMESQDQRSADDRRDGTRGIDDPARYGSVPPTTVPAGVMQAAPAPKHAESETHDQNGRNQLSDAPNQRKHTTNVSQLQQREPAITERSVGGEPADVVGQGQVSTGKGDARVTETGGSKPGKGSEKTADAKRSIATLSVAKATAGAIRKGLPIRESKPSAPVLDHPQAAAGPVVSDHSVAVGDKPGKGRVAEIDVVLENSGRSATGNLKGAVVRGQEDLDRKEHRGGSARDAANDGPRKAAGAASEERHRPERKTRIVVRDLRSRGAREGNAGTISSGGVKVADGSATGSISGGDPQSAGDSFNALLGVRSANSDTVSPRGIDTPAHGRSASGVLQSLRQTLSDQVNGEIVRTARMVVRGNETGEIRLHLKPESLGNVRIILQMEEGHIAGRIIVENSSVREVFEQNLASLIKAFNESGLETGTLEVALANSGGGSQAKPHGGHLPSAVRELEHAVPLMQLLEEDHELVDLVV